MKTKISNSILYVLVSRINYILYLLLLFFSNDINAQPKNSELSLYKYKLKGKIKQVDAKKPVTDEYENTKEVYTSYLEFNKNGLLTMEIVYSFDGEIEKTMKFDYDSSNNVIEKKELDPQDNLVVWQTWKYDKKGKLIENGNYNRAYRYYDPYKKNISDSIYINTSDEAENYEYTNSNTNGDVLEAIFYNKSGLVLRHSIFRYNKFGEQTDGEVYIKDEVKNGLILKFKKTIKFDDKNYIKEESDYGANGMPKRRINFLYINSHSKKDSLLNEIIKTDYNDAGVITSVYSSNKYSYDSAGRKIEEIEFGEDGSIVKLYRFAYSRDGKIISSDKSEYNSFGKYYEVRKMDIIENKTEFIKHDVDGNILEGKAQYKTKNGLKLRDSAFGINNNYVDVYKYLNNNILVEIERNLYTSSGIKEIYETISIYKVELDASGKTKMEIYYSNLSEVIKMKTFEYNAQGIRVGLVTEVKGIPVSYEKYDQWGNRAEYGAFDSLGKSKKIESAKYYGKDKKMEIARFRDNGKLSSLNRFDIYSNDIERTSYNEKGMVIRKTIKKYFAKDKKSEEISYSEDGSYKKIKYDLLGNQLEKGNYSSDGYINSKTVCKYNSKNNKMEKIDYKSDGSYKVIRYDLSDNIIENSTYKSVGVLKTKYTYTYNSLGVKIFQTNYSSDGTQWARKYDQFGKEIEVVCTKSNGNNFKFTYLYEYDSRGNWTKQNKYHSKNIGVLGEFYETSATQEIIYYP